MKRIVALMLALLMLSMAGTGAMADRLQDILAADRIVVATCPDFIPMEFLDTSKTGQARFVGAEVALMQYIAENLGVELVIEAMDFPETLKAVAEGRVDLAASGYAWTQERAEMVALSDFYNFETEGAPNQGLLIRKKDESRYKTAEDFQGKRVAVQSGSLQASLLTALLPDARPQTVSNLNDAVRDLLDGDVVAVCVSYDNGEAFIAAHPDELMMSRYVLPYSTEGAVLAAQKGETALMTRINAIIAEVNARGLFNQWIKEAERLAEKMR
jgi:polar amino acid transport system substrate-binding protein